MDQVNLQMCLAIAEKVIEDPSLMRIPRHKPLPLEEKDSSLAFCAQGMGNHN